MNIIHFSPHFPDNYYRFSVGLKLAGATALGIGDAPYDSLCPELKAALTEYYRVDSMENYDQVLGAVNYFTHRHGKMDRIDSFNEYWLDLEAQIRTDFDIFGLRTEGMNRVKRKSRMKEGFREGGIAVARGVVAPDLTTARTFVGETGFPLVAKPDRGVGALNTYKIGSDAELAAFFAAKPEADYILEEFIDGDIMSFDGLTDHEGKIVFCTGHAYLGGIMETVNQDEHIWYCSYRSLPEDLETAGRRAVSAFDIRERFFHIATLGGRTKATNRHYYVILEFGARSWSYIAVFAYEIGCLRNRWD